MKFKLYNAHRCKFTKRNQQIWQDMIRILCLGCESLSSCANLSLNSCTNKSGCKGEKTLLSDEVIYLKYGSVWSKCYLCLNCVSWSCLKAVCDQYTDNKSCEDSIEGCTFLSNICRSAYKQNTFFTIHSYNQGDPVYWFADCNSLPKGTCIETSCGWRSRDSTCHCECHILNISP